MAEGRTIDLSGSRSNLVLLGAVDNGTATGTLTITCTDGTQRPAGLVGLITGCCWAAGGSQPPDSRAHQPGPLW